MQNTGVARVRIWASACPGQNSGVQLQLQLTQATQELSLWQQSCWTAPESTPTHKDAAALGDLSMQATWTAGHATCLQIFDKENGFYPGALSLLLHVLVETIQVHLQPLLFCHQLKASKSTLLIHIASLAAVSLDSQAVSHSNLLHNNQKSGMCDISQPTL